MMKESYCTTCFAVGVPFADVSTLLGGGMCLNNSTVLHDPNTHWAEYVCINGHYWIDRWVNPCNSCGYVPRGTRPVERTELDGPMLEYAWHRPPRIV